MPFDNLLKQQATLQKATGKSRSEMGQENISWSTIRSGIPVLVLETRPPADVRLGLEEEVTHVVFARPISEVAADPEAQWRFLIDGLTEDVRYVLIEPRNPGKRDHHWEIRTRRVS